MGFTAQDVVPISEARARLTELSDEVVAGAEKLLTKNGAAYVAIVEVFDTEGLIFPLGEAGNGLL